MEQFAAEKKKWAERLQMTLRRGEIENEALFSNMSEKAQALIEELASHGGELNKHSVLTMIKNALKTLRVEDIWGQAWEEVYLRVKGWGLGGLGSNDFSALGLPMTEKQMRAAESWAKTHKK